LAAKVRFGLVGLGNLGRNFLQLQRRRASRFRLFWVTDSSHFVSRRDGREFGASEMSKVLRAKQGADGLQSLGEPFRVSGFGSAKEEAHEISGFIEPNKGDWVIVDTTFLGARDSSLLASSFMGVAGFCTANKTPWADYERCRRLYAQAIDKKTFLGLNCTQGVWLDQMEYIPIAATRLETRIIQVTKRDNSSLNFLFNKASEGLSPDAIYRGLADGGYLEPGGTDLLPEIKDQLIKARISANICSIVGGLDLRSREQTPSQILASGPASASVSDLCAWHISGRKDGYPSLVTEMNLDGQSRTVNFGLSFRTLDRRHPLGRSFQGANAFSIAVTDGEGAERSFTHRGGPGGSANTARRLAREADDVVRLAHLRSHGSFSPIPVLAGLAARDSRTLRSARKLLNVLG
jgi:hypothetical protein